MKDKTKQELIHEAFDECFGNKTYKEYKKKIEEIEEQFKNKCETCGK